jgi:outer membrane receptor protein involved in Fe transport
VVRPGANPIDTGYGYANALLGVYQSFSQAQHHLNGLYRYWNIEQYVQDTWKITSRLTLDYGLRAAWYQPQYDAGLQASTFVLSQWDPKQSSPAVPAGGQPGEQHAQRLRSGHQDVSSRELHWGHHPRERKHHQRHVPGRPLASTSI